MNRFSESKKTNENYHIKYIHLLIICILQCIPTIMLLCSTYSIRLLSGKNKKNNRTSILQHISY